MPCLNVASYHLEIINNGNTFFLQKKLKYNNRNENVITSQKIDFLQNIGK